MMMSRGERRLAAFERNIAFNLHRSGARPGSARCLRSRSAARSGELSASWRGVPGVVRGPRPVRIAAEAPWRPCSICSRSETRALAIELPAAPTIAVTGALPPRVASMLEVLGAGCLEIGVDRRARIRFDGVVESAARLRSATAVLNALFRGPETAVYR